MSKIESFKTAVFKIHNPSNRKKAILKKMMVKSHEAYTHTLKKYLPDEEHIKILLSWEKKKRQEHIRNLGNEIDKYIRKRFPSLAGSAKFGVREDVVAQIKSYVELYEEQQNKSRTGKPGIPTIQSISKKHNQFIDYNIYDGFKKCIDLDTESELRDKTAILNKQGNIRPVEIPKNDLSNGFLLLHSCDTNKYYAWINTHTKKSKYVKPANIKISLSRFFGIKEKYDEKGKKKSKPEKLLKEDIPPNEDGFTINSSTGILLPLSFSQEFQLNEFINQGIPKTAKLVYNSETDEYDLHIAFKFVVDKIETETYLGIDRGIYNLASLTVIDKNGIIIKQENIDGKELRRIQKRKFAYIQQKQKQGKIIRDKTRKAIADEQIHITTNKIVEMAKEHKSQIIIENLKNLTSRSPRQKGKFRNNFTKVVNRQQYSKLKDILEYKLKLNGLPKYYDIHPAHTSQTCPECGCIDSGNRKRIQTGNILKMDEFKCIKCNYQADADKNASHIIALKGYFYKEKYKSKSSDSAEKKKENFTNFIKNFNI